VSDISPSILMANGRYFSPFADDAHEALDVTSLALACARECRYANQLPLARSGDLLHLLHYSVAEHSVLLVRHARLKYPRDLELQQELAVHDLHEGITRDLASPLKHFVPGFKPFENQCAMQVRKMLRLPETPDQEVADIARQWDLRIQIDEQRKLFPGKGPWSAERAGGTPLGVEVHCWPSGVAFDEFVSELVTLFPDAV
jgi:hypothetical protein